MPTPPAASPPPKVSRRRRRLLVAGAALVVLAALALAALHTSPARRYVLDRVTDLLAEQNIDIDAESLNFNLFSASVDLRNVRIVSAATPDAPFAIIGHLEADLSLPDLLAGRYVVESARVEGARVHYLVYEDGSDNVPRPPEDPNASGEPLDYLVADARIAGAEMRYENRASDVDVTMPIDEVTIEGDRVTSRHAIAMEARGGQVVTGGRTVALDRLTVDAKAGDNDVAIETLVVEADGARLMLEASGTIEDFAAPVIDAALTADVDAGRAAALAGVETAAAGRVSIDARAAGAVDALAVTARVEGRELAYGELAGASLALDAAYDASSGVATAEALSIEAPWGTVRGTGRVATSGDGRSSAALTATGVDARALMRAFDVTPVAATRVDARVDARWPGLRVEAASGAAAVTLTPTASRPAPGVLPVAGRLDVTAEDGRVVADIGGVDAAGARIAGRVTMADLERLGGRVTLTIDDPGRTAAMAEAFLDRPAGSLLPAETAGSVSAVATLDGTLAAPAAGVTLDAAWGEARAHAAGRVGFAAGAPIDLTFDATTLRVPDLVAAAGQDRTLAGGTLSVTGRVDGTFDRPAVTASVTGQDLIVSNEPLGTLAADVALAGNAVTVDRLVLDKPQPDGAGRLSATGTYDLDTQAYTFTVDSDNLELTSLTLPDGQPLRGELTIAGRGEGTVEAPAANLTIAADALRYGEREIGSVTVQADVAGGAADVHVTAPRFALDADARIETASPYAATLDARIASLDLTALPLPPDTPLTGLLTATVDAAGTLTEPAAADARVSLEAFDGTWNDRPFALASPAGIALAGERITIDGLTLTAEDSSVSVSGALPLDADTTPGELTIDARANLATLAAYAPDEIGLTAEGVVTLTGTIAGHLERLDPRIEVAVDDASVDTPDLPRPLTGVTLGASVADGVATLDTLTAGWGEARLSAVARAPLGFVPGLPDALPAGSGGATATATLTGLDLATVPGAPEDLGGQVGVELELAADRPDPEAATGIITFTALDVALDTLTLAQQQPSTIRIGNGSATIERLALSGTAGSIDAAGSVGLAGPRPLDVTMDGALNVAALSSFTDAFRADGEATIDVTARGTVADPDLAGALTLTDATLIVDEPEVVAQGVSARVELAGDRVTLARLDGTLNGGSLDGSGGFAIEDGALEDVDVRITAAGVAFEAPLDLRSLSDTTLTITERGDTILVAGQVTIAEAGLTGDLDLDTGLLATIAAPPELDLTTERNPLLEQIRFDVEVVTETPILVDNNLARAEITTDLRVLGTPYEMGLSGRLVVLEGGEITLNERRYAVERGTITFLDERRIQPSMDLRLTTTAGRYDVTLGVTGEPGDTETTLISDPVLPEPDIMALLVTGRTLDEMRGEEYDVAREQVMSYLAGRIGSSLGRDLERATGLSEVRLEPNLIANEADPSARLTIGQDLTQDLTLVFSTDLADSNDQIWSGRYDLTRRLETSATRQSDGSYRFDLRHDVRAGGRPAPERIARTRPEIASVRVESDGVVPEAELLSVLGLEAGDAYDYFTAHEGVRAVEAALVERGRLQSRVRLERAVDAGTADSILHVRAGPVVEIAYAGAQPPGRVDEAVREQWHRGVFDSQRADDAIDVLRAWLIEDRYLSPEVEYRIDEAGDARQVVFAVDRGQHFDRVEREFPGAGGVDPAVLDDIITEQDLALEVFTDPLVVTELLERYYREEGFLLAEVDAPDYEFAGATARVVMTVREGPRFTVGDVAVRGTTAIDEAALAADLPIVSGDPYLPRVAARSLDRIRDRYWDLAYNDVRSEYALTVDRDTGVVDVTFEVEEGPRSVVAGVTIEGEDDTSERLVREQFELDPSDPLDLALLSRSRRNLYDTGAFSLVDITREPGAADNGDVPVEVTVAVREVQPFQLRYGGSYDTERGLGGIVDISNHNSLGKARVLGFSGRYDARLREGRVYVSQPSLLYYPVQTTASVYYSEERAPETGVTDPFNVDRLGASLQQERELANAYVWTYGYRYERARKAAAVAGGPAGETIAVSPLTSTFLRETRDEILDASTGSFTSHAFGYSPSWLGADSSYVKYFGQYFKYLPLEAPRRKRFTNEILRPRFVYAVGARLGLAWGPDRVPETERFYAGGSTTLRGFEQNSVGPIGPDGIATGGEALVVLNNEIRVPLFSIVDGVGFLDIGNVFGRAADFSLTAFREAAGVGLRIRTPWFLIRGDYGVILDLRPGETRSRFYFSIGQAF